MRRGVGGQCRRLASSLPNKPARGCNGSVPIAEPARPVLARPVLARAAASLVVVRGTAEGPEVLMGVRDAGHRFMPNRLVFPGGAVDPADARAPAATEPRPDFLATLGHHARPGLARALAVAAARELREETGLSLGDPPRLDAMDYLCRAITPVASPIRFNARFLVVPAEAATGDAADSRELHGVAFRPVATLLQAPMMQVTREVLLRLTAWLDLPPCARRASRPLHVYRERRWTKERRSRARSAPLLA